MSVSYNKLFKPLIDKQMKKGELCKAANISSMSISKLSKGQNVTMDILIKIYDALDCKMDDSMKLLPDEESVK
jgi:DNA-binding Xre family transcriptional regulator